MKTNILLLMFVFTALTALVMVVFSLLGLAGSWVASRLGYNVDWQVCAVALFLVSAIIGKSSR
jgi:hypothetical protein